MQTLFLNNKKKRGNANCEGEKTRGKVNQTEEVGTFCSGQGAGVERGIKRIFFVNEMNLF